MAVSHFIHVSSTGVASLIGITARLIEAIALDLFRAVFRLVLILLVVFPWTPPAQNGIVFAGIFTPPVTVAALGFGTITSAG